MSSRLDDFLDYDEEPRGLGWLTHWMEDIVMVAALHQAMERAKQERRRMSLGYRPFPRLPRFK